MVVVSDLAIYWYGRVEGAVLTAADAAHDRIVMGCLLLTGQGPYSAVYFEVFDNVSLPLDELVKELVYCVIDREQLKLYIKRRDC